jgi:hypothetical protein
LESAAAWEFKASAGPDSRESRAAVSADEDLAAASSLASTALADYDLTFI